jgi:hypothetical protein
MNIAGLSIIAWLGLLNLLLLLFQLSSGLRWIKPPFGVHRKVGITLVVSAVVHGLLGFAANL